MRFHTFGLHSRARGTEDSIPSHRTYNVSRATGPTLLISFQSGTAQVSRCGAAVSSKLNSDPTGPIENAMKKVDADYNCNAYLCRGYQYEDNMGRVQAYSAGQTVPFFIDLVAAHRPGWAVSSRSISTAITVVKGADGFSERIGR